MRFARLSLLVVSLGCLALFGCSGVLTSFSGAPAPGAPGAAGMPGGPTDPDNPPGGNGGGIGSMPPLPSSCAPSVTKPRIWRLTEAQYQKTVTSLVSSATAVAQNALEPDSTRAGFTTDSNVLTLIRQDVPKFVDATDAISAAAMANPGALNNCLSQAAGLNDAACVQSMVTGFGQRAFRRPLEANETSALMALYNAEKTANGGKEAVQQVLRALFQSPHFLFRTELGAPGSKGATPLTDYEKASLLSYTLTDSPPDTALFAAASQGTLSARPEVEKQVRRLMTGADAEAVYGRFGVELLGVSHLEDVAKDGSLVKGFGPAISKAMRDEVASFVAQVAFREDKSFKTLLTSPVAVIDRTLAPWYGVATPSSLQRVTLPATERAGLLTRLAMMTEYATDTHNEPIRRGLMIRDQFLCNGALQIPANIPPAPPLDSSKTLREQLVEHSANPACASCHEQMDPLGFAFEGYDLAGRFRTTDHGKPVDVTGTAKGVASADIAHTGALDLSVQLAALPEAQACYVRQLGRFYLGRDVGANSCDLAQSFQAFAGAGNNIAEPVATYLTDAALSQRVP